MKTLFNLILNHFFLTLIKVNFCITLNIFFAVRKKIITIHSESFQSIRIFPHIRLKRVPVPPVLLYKSHTNFLANTLVSFSSYC